MNSSNAKLDESGKVSELNKVGSSGRWISIISLALLIMIGIGVLLPIIQDSRDRARQNQSVNQLRQIGLCLANYHDTMRKFPPGGLVDKSRDWSHGWSTFILPYVEASPLYDQIDKHSGWDSPFNQHIYRFEHHAFLHPAIPTKHTSTGYALAHYSLNENLFNLGKPTTFADLEPGQAHVWLGVERFGQWRPWGSPYNWQGLPEASQSKPENSVWRDGGIHFLMGDLSYQFISADQYPVQRELLQANSPNAPVEVKANPGIEYSYDDSDWEISHYEIPKVEISKVDRLVSFARVVRRREASVFVEVVTEPKVRETKALYAMASSVEDLKAVIKKFPAIETLKINIKLDDEAAKHISRIKGLRFLDVGQNELTPSGLNSLAKLDRLEIVNCDLNAGQLREFSNRLPHCVIR